MKARSILVLGLSLTLWLPLSAPKADDGEPSRRITVSGQGEVQAVPDMATISIGVETEAATPSEALSENAARMTAVMGRLESAGIPPEDMQTSQLGIWPVYAERQQQERVTGYRASNQLTVTIKDLQRLGSLLDDTVADGANSIGGPSFGVAEPAPLLEAARDAAVADAIARAERYAKAAGVVLGQVIAINEGGGGPVFARHARAEAMAAGTPIAPGERSFSATVSMTFAIE